MKKLTTIIAMIIFIDAAAQKDIKQYDTKEGTAIWDGDKFVGFIKGTKKRKKLFELTGTVGYMIHKQTESAVSSIYFNVGYPSSKKYEVKQTGQDIKTNIRFSVSPFKSLSIGVTGSQNKVGYEVLEYKQTGYRVFTANPLWQYGGFATYNQSIGESIILFAGINVTNTSRAQSGHMILYNQPGMSKSTISKGGEIGIKYKITGPLYATAIAEYATMVRNNYYCMNAGFSFKF